MPIEVPDRRNYHDGIKFRIYRKEDVKKKRCAFCYINHNVYKFQPATANIKQGALNSLNPISVCVQLLNPKRNNIDDVPPSLAPRLPLPPVLRPPLLPLDVPLLREPDPLRSFLDGESACELSLVALRAGEAALETVSAARLGTDSPARAAAAASASCCCFKTYSINNKLTKNLCLWKHAVIHTLANVGFPPQLEGAADSERSSSRPSSRYTIKQTTRQI